MENRLLQRADADLILQAQRGSDSAFEQLVFKYDRQVLTIAARFVQTSDEAKDIYQDVFIRVYRGMKKFRFQSNFSTWLHRITVNVCLTHVARKKRNPQIHQNEYNSDAGEAQHREIPNNNGTPEDLSEAKGIERDVRKGLEILSPNQRAVFTLKYIDDRSIKEIAALINCSEGNVKKHLFIATRRMREHLKEYQPK